jgi:trehalose synthase-fused probable maltokinase
VRVADVVPIEWGGGAEDMAAVVRLVVEAAGVPDASYQLPLVVREAEMSREKAPRAVLACVEAGGVRGVLFDALEDAQFRSRLADALAHGASFEGPRSRWVVEPVGRGAEEIARAPSRVVGTEQSNTSVVYGDRAILKLFRKLEPGENPDVEIARFLTTRTHFRHTPELLGVMRFEERDGTSSVAGMLSRYLAGSTDAWSYALERIRAYLRSTARKEPPNPFAEEARELGRVTRELHDALASDPTLPDFAPREVTPSDVEQWALATRRSIEQGFDLLQARLPSLDARMAPIARAIAGRRAAALDGLDEIVGQLDALGNAHAAGRKIRHHGDYHLGQVLRTPAGDWMIIDFEGEPARPLEERRAFNSPYRDVAGMLRSFAYAAATGAAEVGGLGVNPTVETRSARWERDARAAFLDGYGAPHDQPLITLFEMEKVFYELAYELNNRPGWAWIPLRGIAKVF